MTYNKNVHKDPVHTFIYMVHLVCYLGNEMLLLLGKSLLVIEYQAIKSIQLVNPDLTKLIFCIWTPSVHTTAFLKIIGFCFSRPSFKCIIFK